MDATRAARRTVVPNMIVFTSPQPVCGRNLTRAVGDRRARGYGRRVRILAIDGGGIRGLVPARALARLEAVTGRPVADLFDLVAGTSTGGILACALTARAADGGPRHAAAVLPELYLTEGPRIFRRSLGRRLGSLDGLIDERHDAAGLEDALERYLGGGALLSQARPRLLVTTYDLEAREPFLFKSWRTAEEGREARLTDVARATAAAPTYFEPLAWRSPDGGPARSLVDGGVFATNPALCAYAEAERLAPGEPHVVLSLGTGSAQRPIRHEDARGWGLARWIRPVIDIVFDGVADTVEYQLEHLLGERQLRLQLDLPRDVALDDASPAALATLDAVAQDLLDGPAGRALEAFAAARLVRL
ncbi:patatin [Paraconexibacter algicola]|uniref:Patatin n=1 Tax=Paraconexibacter algicola TaxID=2133960 RepID=A0A2T4UFT4_9ACTN|nr:patatin [Paraconexibacter algicola]